MVNLNGSFSEKAETLAQNRAFNYGDALFETVRVQQGNIIFWEDHYLRLMASMRILRMNIPTYFTPSYLEDQIKKTVEVVLGENQTGRVKLNVYRKNGGFYSPETNDINFLITCKALKTNGITFFETPYSVDIFKDYSIAESLLSNIKSTNRIINVLASIYAKENDLNNCLLINNNKKVVEAIDANIFLIKDHKIITPPLSEGCVKGIMRKNIIAILKKHNHTIEEKSITPFDIQKSNELFLTNIIKGIIPVTQYKRTTLDNSITKQICQLVNKEVYLIS